MIRANAICKSFAGKQVLSGIDLDIKPGMIFGLLGPSGAGKTTLIKIITGQLGFDSGDVTVFEKNVSDLTGTDKKQIGIMMDDHGVYDRLSCTDNLKIFADIYGIPHSKIISVLEEVGLNPKAVVDKTPGEISGGMRKRVGFARALAMEPELMLYDEPTTGLDPIMSDVVNELMINARDRHRVAGVLVTHDMKSAIKVANRLVMLYPHAMLGPNEPQMIFDGDAEAIWKCRDPRVSQFIRGEAGDRVRVSDNIS